MQFYKLLKTIGGTAFILILSGCIIKDSPAPGCVRSIGIPAMGGCFGKTAIVVLEVKKAPECVVIEANNCNGGVLEIRNRCTESIQLDGIVIDASTSVSLDVKETDGAIELVEAHGNFSQYIPEEDRSIEVTGVVGIEPIEFSFTKSKLLCK